MSEDRQNQDSGNGTARRVPINLGLLHPIGTPQVTPLHALAPGAQSLPSLMIQPPRQDSLFPANDTGVQYLSQGPIGSPTVPVSQSIDPALMNVPGTGAYAARQANLQRAADVALSFGPGVIGGERALTAPGLPSQPTRWNLRTLDDAKTAEMGLHDFIPQDRTSIFNATGWFKGADDKWRFIIPDEGARLRTENLRPYTFKSMGEDVTMHGVPRGANLKLPDVLDHQDLYQAYPHLMDVNVHPTPLGSVFDLKGAYNKGNIWLTGGREGDTLSTLLHETQHAVQEHEGFAGGGSTAEFLPSTYNKDMADTKQSKEELEKQIHEYGVEPAHVTMAHGFYPYDKPIRPYGEELKRDVENAKNLPQGLVDEYRNVQERYGDLVSQREAAVKNYLNLGGEIEARSVQAMLHEHQWSRPPWEVPMGRDFMGNPIPYPERTEHIIRFNKPNESGLEGVVLTPVEHDPFATPPGR